MARCFEVVGCFWEAPKRRSAWKKSLKDRLWEMRSYMLPVERGAMPTEIAVGVLPEELAQVVEAVFGTMLKLQVGESGKPWFAGEDRLTGTVHLTGDWSGAVLLECNQRQACGFAGHFLSMDPPEAVDDVVRDVLGELVNMIGGNLKCVLTRGIRLSMPSVVDGSDYCRPM